ncbi:hypothetical protein WA026_013940, partial [Henosepilachna vigintioctopunctata]
MQLLTTGRCATPNPALVATPLADVEESADVVTARGREAERRRLLRAIWREVDEKKRRKYG